MSRQSVPNGRPYGPQIREMMHAFAAKQRGDLISYAELERVTGEARDSNRFRSLMQKWKRTMIRERGYALTCMPKEGYRVMLPDETIRSCAGDSRRVMRTLKRSHEKAAYTPESELSQAGRYSRSVYIASVGRMIHNATSAARDVEKNISLPSSGGADPRIAGRASA